MADSPRARLPWMLVAASVLLVALVIYVLFAGYLPAKRRALDLERELRGLYRREAELQTKLGQQDQRHALRDQLAALTAERDALLRRVEALERELAASRARR